MKRSLCQNIFSAVFVTFVRNVTNLRGTFFLVAILTRSTVHLQYYAQCVLCILGPEPALVMLSYAYSTEVTTSVPPRMPCQWYVRAKSVYIKSVREPVGWGPETNFIWFDTSVQTMEHIFLPRELTVYNS
jgi:hypothetical protein